MVEGPELQAIIARSDLQERLTYALVRGDQRATDGILRKLRVMDAVERTGTKPGDCCGYCYDCPYGGRECLVHGGFDVCCDSPWCPSNGLEPA